MIHHDHYSACALACGSAPPILALHALRDALARMADVDLDKIWGQFPCGHPDVGEDARAQPHLLADLRGAGRDPVLGRVAETAEIADDALEEDSELADVRGGRPVHGSAVASTGLESSVHHLPKVVS